MKFRRYSGTLVICRRVLRQLRFHSTQVESWGIPRINNALKTSVIRRNFMPYLRYPMIHVKHATNWQTKWKCRGPVFRGPRARSSGSFRHNLILHLVFRFSPSSGAPLLCTIAFSISSLASLLVLLRSSRRGSVQVFVSPIQQLITNEVTLTGSGIHMRLP